MNEADQRESGAHAATAPSQPEASRPSPSRYYTYVNDGQKSVPSNDRTPGSVGDAARPVYVKAHIIEPTARSAKGWPPFAGRRGDGAPGGSASPHGPKWQGGSNPQATTPKGGASPHAAAGHGRANAASDSEPQKGGRVVGVVQTVAGAGIALVGIPLLVLPGPGLAAIAGGAALAASGIKKLARK